jgi:acetylornithine deacetylase/succinyl-diaminopimelate desuccinylase-like protein
MNPDRIVSLLKPLMSYEAVRGLMVELAKVPSPQTELYEAEPLLREFIRTAVAPRVQAMGFSDIRFDAMGNLIAHYGAGGSGRSLMLCSNAMNQPQATMTNAYSGDVIDGRPHGLPGEAVMGKGLSEQKATMAAMLHAMDATIRSGVPIEGRLLFLCCVSGETGRHDAIRNVIEAEGVRADMCVLGGNANRISLGNRGRIDVFVTVKGAPSHSSRPHDGCNTVTGAMEVLRRLSDLKLDAVHPQLGKQTLAVTRIRSFPESTHTIQDRCELTVDRRLLPQDDPQEAFRQIDSRAASRSRPRARTRSARTRWPHYVERDEARHSRRWASPARCRASARAGSVPLCRAHRRRGAPTVLGYGHGDVIRGLEQVGEGLNPLGTDRARRALLRPRHRRQQGPAHDEPRRAGGGDRRPRQARLQREVADRDGRGGGLARPARGLREQQATCSQIRCAGRLRRPAARATADDLRSARAAR